MPLVERKILLTTRFGGANFWRKYERYRCIAPVEVFWIGQDRKTCSASGNSLDVSVCGMQVELDLRIGVDSTVKVRFAGRDLSAIATVRNCNQLCSRFRIGLEFERTLTPTDIPGLRQILTDPLRCERGP